MKISIFFTGDIVVLKHCGNVNNLSAKKPKNDPQDFLQCEPDPQKENEINSEPNTENSGQAEPMFKSIQRSVAA